MQIVKIKTVPYIVSVVKEFYCAGFSVEGGTAINIKNEVGDLFWSCKVDLKEHSYVIVFDVNHISFFEGTEQNQLKTNMTIIETSGTVDFNPLGYPFKDFKLEIK